MLMRSKINKVDRMQASLGSPLLESRQTMRVCDAAVAVLRETKNPAVMWGDCGLLDLIAERAGYGSIDEYPWQRHRKTLAALAKRPGILVKRKTYAGERRVNIFKLPEHAA